MAARREHPGAVPETNCELYKPVETMKRRLVLTKSLGQLPEKISITDLPDPDRRVNVNRMKTLYGVCFRLGSHHGVQGREFV